MNTIPDARKTVADVIMEKLTEKKTELQTQMSDESRTVAGGEFQLDDRIVQMYSNIKIVLQKYRSGKLPKAFKILPSLNNWEHVIHKFAEYIKDRICMFCLILLVDSLHNRAGHVVGSCRVPGDENFRVEFER